MDKAAANSFKKNKDYILVQEVCNAWSNANDEPDADGDDPSTDLGCISASRSRISSSVSGNSKYRYQRTKSLCVFYNTNIINYAKSMASNNDPKSKKRASGSGISGGQNKVTHKEMKILQYTERIMEAQNKWTGNGKFILREKHTFLVSISYYLCSISIYKEREIASNTKMKE